MKLSGLLIFTLGAAFGAAATYIRLNAMYAEKAEGEIRSVRNMYKRKYEKENDEQNPEKSEEKKLEKQMEEISKKVEKMNENIKKNSSDESDIDYVDYNFVSKENCKKKEEKPSMNKKEFEPPYVIDENEFLTQESLDDRYMTVTLTLYSDGTLADDLDDEVIPSDRNVGEELMYSFLDSDKDVIYVRNEKRKTDYEIDKDEMTYFEATGKEI